MPKPKFDLADWTVCFAPGDVITVRAVSLKIRDHSYALEDGSGGLVFAAAVSGVRYIKIKGPEDYEHVAARKELAPADPIASAPAEKVAGGTDPKPPLPKRTTGRRTGK